MNSFGWCIYLRERERETARDRDNQIKQIIDQCQTARPIMLPLKLFSYKLKTV